jgi:hypothetical protein
MSDETLNEHMAFLSASSHRLPRSSRRYGHSVNVCSGPYHRSPRPM